MLSKYFLVLLIGSIGFGRRDLAQSESVLIIFIHSNPFMLLRFATVCLLLVNFSSLSYTGISITVFNVAILLVADDSRRNIRPFQALPLYGPGLDVVALCRIVSHFSATS